jgi:hypothetical protein
LAPEPLAQRIRHDESFEIADDLLVVAELEPVVDELLERGEP